MVGELIEYLPYTAIAQFRKEIGKYVDDKRWPGWNSMCTCQLT